MPKFVPYDDVNEVFDLVCSGMSFQAAAAAVGVAQSSATRWWRASGVMGNLIQMGMHGGLPGSAPPGRPGRAEGGQQRRPLTSEDRAVIAAGLRAGCSSYSAHRRRRDRSLNKSVISRDGCPQPRWRRWLMTRTGRPLARPCWFRMNEPPASGPQGASLELVAELQACAVRIEAWMERSAWCLHLKLIAPRSCVRSRRSMMHGVVCRTSPTHRVPGAVQRGAQRKPARNELCDQASAPQAPRATRETDAN